MCSVTVVFIHTMEDDQRLDTLVHEGDTLHYHKDFVVLVYLTCVWLTGIPILNTFLCLDRER